MRIFEAIGCGGMLLTDEVMNGLHDKDKGIRRVATYNNENDLIDAMRYYLENESERKRIAEINYKDALERHTYQHRMKELLKVLK